MRWRRTGSSGDVIDRRGARGRGLPMAGAGGLGGIGLVVFLLVQLIGGGGGGAGFAIEDPFGEGVSSPAYGEIPPAQDPDRDLKDFSAYVFDNAQRTWQETFDRSGQSYERAKLVLFSGGVSTGCGSASSAVGPFYCPADQRVYLDLSFYREMDRLGANGDFAWAYVIAHEVGHHVQRQLGTSEEVRRLQRDDPGDANELSVRLELQADCYAGIWSHSVRAAGDLEQGDIEEALATAEAIGDDRLQRRSGGGVDPESFTHGTSEQRARWFGEGDADGEPAACDTFAADDL